MNEFNLRDAILDDKYQLDEIFREELEFHKKLNSNFQFIQSKNNKSVLKRWVLS